MRISTFFIPLAYPSPYEVPLNLLQGPALSLRYLAPAVERRDQGEGTEQEEHPHKSHPASAGQLVGLTSWQTSTRGFWWIET
jgi:hypothetical protein